MKTKSKGGKNMKNILAKVLLLLLVLTIPFGFVSCGDGEGDETGTDTAPITYETEDEEGWSPIWRP